MGQDLKAWREAEGLSQQAAADRVGVTRAAWASYEGGRRPVPAEVAAQVAGGAQAPPVESKAAPQAIAQEARAETQAMTEKSPPHLRGKNARRPTKEELRDYPHRFGGPNVWVVVNDPPKPNGFGSFIRLEITKFSESGHGWPSTLLVGTRGNKNPDKESLASYKPFRPGLGSASQRPSPGGGKRAKAA